MFARLRTQRFLKVRVNAGGLEVSFRGRAAIIAITHQYGERYTDHQGRQPKMPQRELLSLNDHEMKLIVDVYLDLLDV